jgi:uncharacterized integral membrane protein (TIGR00697 family)
MNIAPASECPTPVSHGKYFMYVALFFVVIEMISNTVAVKLIPVGPFVFTGAIYIFPISYIFGDILTEVYGYRASRKVIWCGFASLVMMSAAYMLVEYLPAATFWTGQDAYVAILGFVPRIVVASIAGFFVGEFCNSYVLSKMKRWTNGKHLWTRTIGSTIVGEGVDSITFVVIAFWGTIPLLGLMTVIWSSYVFKVVYEVVATPLTYWIVNTLKRVEQVDVFDQGVDYNPFTLS